MSGARTSTLALLGILRLFGASPAAAQQSPPSGPVAPPTTIASAEHLTWLRASESTVAPLRKTVSLNLHQTPLRDALDAIAATSGLQIGYGLEVVRATTRVSLHVDGMTVGEALGNVLTGTPFTAYVSVTGKQIIVRTPFPVSARAQVRQQGEGTVSGLVIDAVTKVGLDQVAVRVEGSGTGSVTTHDGRYTVRNVPVGVHRLTARRVGYSSLTTVVVVATDSVATADFALAAAPTRLTEMVTTAVGDQRRYEVGNVISTINADSITPTAPITSLTDLISARAPGVQVEETGGLTGSGESIRIRGQGSLVLQGDPIVIVDGVRQDNSPGGTYTNVGYIPGVVPSPSRLNDLDFRDIASIDVLKGPAASTEYGTDAANGVIVIKTKHGNVGRPQWAASAEQTASAIPKQFPTLYHSWGHTTDPSHTPTQCPLVTYAFGVGVGSSDHSCAVDSVTTWDPLNNSQYSVFGTGRRGKYDLSVSGGSELVRYFVSGGLSNETGALRLPSIFHGEANTLGLPHSLFQPNGQDQRSVRANTAITLGPTADLSLTGSYLSNYQETVNAQNLLTGVLASTAVRDSADAYGYSQFPYFGPVYQLGQPNTQTTNRLTGGMNASWRPATWLTTHATFGIDHGSQRVQAINLPQVAFLYARFPTPQLQVGLQTTDIYTGDLRASATTPLTRSLRAVTSLGLQLADTRLQGAQVFAPNITATNLTLNGAVNPTVAQLGNRQATLGGYGEEQLAIAERLFLTGAVRIDAGSGFGRSYNTAVYPKASVSWLAVNAGPTTVRLRGAFGESGVQPPNGAALQLFAPAIAWQAGGATSVVAINNAENPLLQPERSSEYEGGVDVSLWQNRVSAEVTGYSKTTRNALVSTGTGWDLGGLSYEENIGKVRNTGAEATVTATVLQARTVTWDVSLNASVNRNKLISLAPGILSQEFTGVAAVFRFAPGFPLYGYWAPRVQYADLNHDGILEPNEVTVANTFSYVGTSSPTREMSLGTHVALLRGVVSLGALADYRGGFRLLNADVFQQEIYFQTDRAANDPKAPLWQQARDVAAEYIYTTGADNYAPPAGLYEDGTYLRLREVSLTYALPRLVTRAMHIQTASLTGAVRNLALWTRYGGTDPEVTNSGGYNNQSQATSNTFIVNHDIREDFSAVPLPRYWVVRLNVGL